MKHVKQTIAIFLTLLMLVTAVPFGVFAAEECDHVWKDKYSVPDNMKEPANCQQGATYYLLCTKCGVSARTVKGAENQTYTEGDKDPKNHPSDKIVAINPPAADAKPICQEGGTTPGRKCTACNTVIEEPKTVGKQNHRAAPGKEATCVSKAVCEYCGEEFGTTNADNHPKDKVEVVQAGKPATCGEDGTNDILVCYACQKTIQKATTIPATGKHTQKTPATCTKKATCAVCGKEYGEIDAKAHTLKENKAVTANCVEGGKKAYWECTECKKLFSDAEAKNTISKVEETTKDPANHKNLKEFPKKDATCKEEGNSAYWFCDGCNKYYSDKDAKTEIKQADTKIEKVAHDWGDWVYPADYTCAKGGTVSRECKVCKEKETKTAKPGEHIDLVTEKAVEPTCTVAGKSEKIYCKKCGTVITDATEVAALGHDYTNAKAVAKDSTNHVLECTRCKQQGDPVACTDADKDCKCDVCGQQLAHVFTNYVSDGNATCGADGTKTATCDVCGKGKDTIPDENSKATAQHQYEWTDMKDATCIANGHRKGKCRICEAETIEEIPDSATGHTESDWKYPEGYDCEVGGNRYRECIVCHQILTSEPIGPQPHSEFIDPEVPKTCTTDGKSAGIHCDICGKVITPQVIYKAEGHKPDANGFVTTKEATCTADGTRTAKCAVCGETFTDVIKAKGHTYKDTIVPPTCTGSGYTLHKCTAGDYEFKDNIVPATGHKMKESIKPATTSANGKVVLTCSVCGKKQADKIYKIKTIKLSETTFVRDGKSHKPSVIIKDAKGTKLKKNTDYTLKYSSGRKAIGTYKVIVTFKGEYKGKKTLKFQIVPPAVKSVKAKAGFRNVALSWASNKFADIYVIYRATSKNGTYKKIGSTEELNFTATKLTSGTTYYFKVVAVRQLDSGNVYGLDSAIKKATAK